MFDACIVGAYTTVQSHDLSQRGGFSLALEALRGAADDAGIALADIDGIAAVVVGGDAASMGAFWARLLGHPMRGWVRARSCRTSRTRPPRSTRASRTRSRSCAG
jgi:hypothetical protein